MELIVMNWLGIFFSYCNNYHCNYNNQLSQ